MFFLFLKTFSLILDFAVILCNTFPCTKKFLSDSYAANFWCFCQFCIFDAKVRNFPETTKFCARRMLLNLFKILSRSQNSAKLNFLAIIFQKNAKVSHFPGFPLLTSVFLVLQKGNNNIIYNIYIIYYIKYTIYQ